MAPINNFQTENLVKIAAVAGELLILTIMFIYLIFAFVHSRRIKIMNLNLKTPYAKSFVKISKIHMVLVLLIIILTIFSIK
jgi:ABC-type Fe3+-siderophore transport system permease subunit